MSQGRMGSRHGVRVRQGHLVGERASRSRKGGRCRRDRHVVRNKHTHTTASHESSVIAPTGYPWDKRQKKRSVSMTLPAIKSQKHFVEKVAPTPIGSSSIASHGKGTKSTTRCVPANVVPSHDQLCFRYFMAHGLWFSPKPTTENGPSWLRSSMSFEIPRAHF